jgi:hypothetical protein
MQFHLNGFIAGDPEAHGVVTPREMPEQVDVLVVRAAPAGLTSSTRLATFPAIVTRVAPQRRRRPHSPAHLKTISLSSASSFDPAPAGAGP